MWTCGTCGEQMEDSFDACWNCQSVRVGTIPLPQQPAAGDDLSFDMSVARASLADLQERESVSKATREAAYRDAYQVTKQTGMSQCDVCGSSFMINEMVGRTWLAAVWKVKTELAEVRGTQRVYRTTESTIPVEPKVPISVWLCRKCFWDYFHTHAKKFYTRLAGALSIFLLLLPLVLIGTPFFYYFLVFIALIVTTFLILAFKIDPGGRLRAFYKYGKKRAIKKSARFYLMDDLELLRESLQDRLTDKLRAFGKNHVGILIKEDDSVPKWLIDDLEQLNSKSQPE